MSLLTVVYTGEPDETFEFRREGQAALFGRDDVHCDIVIWSAINGQELSRIAGRIWRMDHELWLRNLSTRHDLYLEVPGSPAEQPLPPRQELPEDPGPARSIPAPLAFIRGPAGCELLVCQQRGAYAGTAPQLNGEQTLRLPPVPAHLKPVVAALCEPLLDGGQLPATYSEIAQRTGLPAGKRMRNLVAELCQPYVAEVPQLRRRIIERRQREEAELALPADPKLQHGIWSFDTNGPEKPAEPAEIRRRRALALPDYYEVAHLLVRRRLVATTDVAALLPPRNGATS